MFLSFTGDYRVGIKFNDEPIPDSPFKVFILPDVGEGRKIELGHVPDAGNMINKPIAFTIQMNGAKGLIDGKIVSPSGGEDDCFVSPIDEGRTFFPFVIKLTFYFVLMHFSVELYNKNEITFHLIVFALNFS